MSAEFISGHFKNYSKFESYEKPQDECAIVGVFSRNDHVAKRVFNGLVELNHRGQEDSGICVTNGRDFNLVKDSGLAGIVFTIKTALPDLEGAYIAIGHNRYSTSGTPFDRQPFYENGIALSHNGNLTNLQRMIRKYDIPEEIGGAKSDTRIALAMINKMEGNEEERIKKGIKEMEGAYCMVFATKNALYATRDSKGFRPLSLGRTFDGNGWVVASETAAFPSMGAEFVRDILPGETIRMDDEGVVTIELNKESSLAQCIFELIYIARPDSVVFGKPVMDFRIRQGEILARHLPDVDLVMPVPRSGIGAALGVGMSETVRSRGIVYTEGLYTNPYRGVVDGARTFIQEPQGRSKAVTEKYSANESIVRGKRIAIIDDSIIRGSLKKVVEKLRDAGALEIHALIASPEIRYPCYMGIDMSTSQELIAYQIPDLQERARYLGLDSLYYLSYSELIEAATGNPVDITDASVFQRHNFCGACFSGEYPIPVEGVIRKHK